MSFDEQTYEMIEAYLNDTLSDTERASFEERVNKEPNLANEIAINREMRVQYGNINENYTDNTPEKYDQKTLNDLKTHLQSEEINTLSKKIKKGKEIYEATATKKPTFRYIYYVAAAIALILLINTFFINNTSSTEELYAEYSDWKDLPSLTAKSGNQNKLAKGEALFNKEKYTEAIAIFNNNEYLDNPHVLMYLGVSYLESDNLEKALDVFNQLLNSKTLESNKAYWYISLTYLKQGQIEKAIEFLNLLRQDKNNYQYEKAGELLSKLDND